MEFNHTKNFWNGLAAGNHREALVGHYDAHMADENEEKILFMDIPLDGTLTALDFGCGPGRNMIKFKDRFKRIDGVDISSVVLDKARLELKEANVEIPNLYVTNGYDLTDIPSDTYDVVFSIICIQHIGSRDWRLSLFKEFRRVLKDGGVFTFQTGFGPGHPISVDYFHNYTEADEAAGGHFDHRVEDVDVLVKDLLDCGFVGITHMLTDPCRDQHPQWIWVQATKENQ